MSLSFVVSLIGRLWSQFPTSYWCFERHRAAEIQIWLTRRVLKTERPRDQRTCFVLVRQNSRQISCDPRVVNMADPMYTEFGIKIHKLRFTLKVQRRTPTPSVGSEDGRSIRSRANSITSTISENLGLLNFARIQR